MLRVCLSAIFGAVVGVLSTYFVLESGLLRAPSLCSGQDVSCTREWIGALSGWAAVGVAGVSVLLLNRQIKVSREMREEEVRQRAVAIADAIAIDLIATSVRVRGVELVSDLKPPLSSTAADLFKDAVYVAPRLAAALKEHLARAESFMSLIELIDTIGPENAVFDLEQRREKDAVKLGYEARLLAFSFTNASKRLAGGQIPEKPPFLTVTQVTVAANDYGIEPADHRLTQYLLGEPRRDHSAAA